MKTYLITGGCGFIGSNFIDFMLTKYEDINIINLDKLTYAGNLENLKSHENDKRYHFVQGDICDEKTVSRIFSTWDIDYLVNFAAESHVDRSIENPEIFVESNVMGTLNLLKIAKKFWSVGEDCYRTGVKFLQVSTDEVYGSLGKTGYFTEKTALSPHSPYSASKTSADCFVKAFFDTYKLPVNITRCSNNYGPYQFPEKLIPLIFNNAILHKDLPIYGDGSNIRDWLYVKDHCKGIDMVINNGRLGEIYNIGGHNEKTNLDIVKTIIRYVNEHDATVDDSLIKYVKDRKGHDKRYGIDPTKIKNDLGWFPETPFEEGIKLTLDWYMQNKEWMKHVTSGEYQTYYEKHYKEK